MAHHTTIPDTQYAIALRRGKTVIELPYLENYNVSENVIVSEYNIKGDYITGNQLYTVIDIIKKIKNRQGEICYIAVLNVMNNSHA